MKRHNTTNNFYTYRDVLLKDIETQKLDKDKISNIDLNGVGSGHAFV
jgi:hypothetical protein